MCGPLPHRRRVASGHPTVTMVLPSALRCKRQRDRYSSVFTVRISLVHNGQGGGDDAPDYVCEPELTSKWRIQWREAEPRGIRRPTFHRAVLDDSLELIKGLLIKTHLLNVQTSRSLMWRKIPHLSNHAPENILCSKPSLIKTPGSEISTTCIPVMDPCFSDIRFIPIILNDWRRPMLWIVENCQRFLGEI